MLSAPRHRERAFTMIEIVVAMILLVFVVGAIVAAIGAFTRGNADSMGNRAAQREALDLLEQMRSDVRVARSPGIDQWDGRRETLRDLLFFEIDDVPDAGSPSRQACGAVTYVTCLRDITHADPNDIWFRADIRRGSGWAGQECVGYQFRTTGVTRVVGTGWQNCGPNSGGNRTLVMKFDQTAATASLASPLKYTLRYNPLMQWRQQADPKDCISSQPSTVNGRALNWITSVNVDLSGIRSETGDSATNGLKASLAVTTRLGGDFTYATGCSL